MPKVSVVIPTFNRPELLRRSLKSVLDQTYSDFEVIIIDDGDKERAEKVISEFDDGRVRYKKNEPPRQGGGATRNAGVHMAKGEYIAFLDDDDEWISTKLAIQMEKMLEAPESVGFSFTSVLFEYDDGKESVSVVEEGVRDYFELALSRFKGFLTVTLIIKKEVFDQVGGFDESLPSHQDPELILRIAEKWKGLGINMPLVKVNMHSGREHIGGDTRKRIDGRLILLHKHADKYKHRPATLAKLYFRVGIWYGDLGETDKAREFFLKAFFLSYKFRYLFHYFRNWAGFKG